MKYRRLVWPLSVTLLAAFVRWHRLDDIRLTWDHAYPIAQAQMLLSKGEWPMLGQATTFFVSNPPGQAYVNLMPLALFGSMWGVFWFITTVNLLAVPLLYRLGREVFDEREALIGSFLIAVSPWVVLYSRTTWSSALVPIGTTLILALLLPALSELPHPARYRRLLAALIGLTILTQSYLLALFIAPVQVGLILLLRFRHIPWRAVQLGGAIFSAGLGLFAFNLIRDWSFQATRLTKFAESAAPQIRPQFEALQLAVRYATSLDYRTAPIIMGTASPTIMDLAQVCGYLLAAVLLLGVTRALYGFWRRQPSAWISAALLIWWLTPIVLMSLDSHRIHPWHLRLSLPAGHLLIARGLRPIWTRRRASGWLMLTGGLGLAVISFANFNADSLYNAAHPAAFELDHITLGASRRIGQALRRLTEVHKVNEIYANLPWPSPIAWSQRPLTTVSWFVIPDRIIVPMDRPAIYVRLGHGAPTPPFDLARRVETIAFPGGDSVVFDVFPAMDRPTIAALPQTRVDWPSETGLTLLGYTFNRPLRIGETITVTTYWLVENLTESRPQYIYGPYLHLDATDDSIYLNAGAPGIEGSYYRQGDLYIQPIQLPIPPEARPGEYQLELGLYDGVHTIGTTFFPPNDIPRPFYTTTVALP